jgi:hypothetical protein
MAKLLDHRMMNSQMQGGVDQSRLYAGPGKDLNVPSGGALFGAASEGNGLSELTETKRKLAKRANAIYRSLCNELELGECFFNGFGAWSEFVEGKISETSFYEKAKEEARVIAERLEKVNG